MVDGRKPTPTEQRLRRGETVAHTPVVIGGRVAPDRPPYFNMDQIRMWESLVTDLMEADVIDKTDAGVIEAAVVFWSRARESRKAMRGQPLLIMTPQGQVPNRLLEIERNSWREFRGLAESLPLSPYGRARLGLKSKNAGKGSESDIGLPPRLRAVGE